MAAEVAVLTPESINSTTQDHFSESPIEAHPPLPIQSIVEDEQEELTQDNIVKTEEEEMGPLNSEDVIHQSMENGLSNDTDIMENEP